MFHTRRHVAIARHLLPIIAVTLLPTLAAAQDGACQLVHPSDDPSLDVLQCPSGPSVTAEKAADVHVSDPAGQGHPTGAAVNAGGALIDVPAGYPGGFQVTMPRAIASVRGTRWVVDVSPTETSVFVLRGEVSVARTGPAVGVVLHKGEGVDVDDGTSPLRVTQWPGARVAKLLARFGQR